MCDSSKQKSKQVKGIVLPRSKGCIASVLLCVNPVIHLYRSYEYADLQKVLEGFYEEFRY